MAQKQLKVYLGYEDEYITEKNKYHVNFTTSKIGGKPDWPSEIKATHPLCSLCSLQQLLVVQIYAPLDNSPYHRTLYIFACINPNCWNHNESWTCLRSQCLDTTFDTTHVTSTSTATGIAATDWVKDADDWDDEENGNINEENGNLINITNTEQQKSDPDDEDESYSMEDSLRIGIEELYVDNKNSNNGKLAEAQGGGGAVGRLQSPIASAEIEGEESEVVSIDTPTTPQRNLVALLQEVASLPPELCVNKEAMNKIEFCSFFISIGDEDVTNHTQMNEHIRDLINEYQLQNEDEDFNQEFATATSSMAEAGDSGSVEKYEQTTPFHGDKIFHHFITKIQMNPGQIIRYSRGHPIPLLIAPITEFTSHCQYCNSDMIFEMQILPTIIPKLRLTTVAGSVTSGTHVEFGNILIFTCSKSCWKESDNVRKEMVIVQTERY